MTKKIFENNSYQTKCSCEILKCIAYGEKKFGVIVSQTVFAPTGGGQYCDLGTIGDVAVTEVLNTENGIEHFVPCPFEVGSTLEMEIDFARRFRNMQCHTGEHILSGIVSKLFGFNNVGFHIGADDVTVDYDGILSEKDIGTVEKLVNEAIYKAIPVVAYYPSQSELASLMYRSKKKIDEALRIVSIAGIDTCACCVPHLNTTAEVGVIKIVAVEKNKSGVRLTILAGMDGFLDYQKIASVNHQISALLSAKPYETFNAASKMQSELLEKQSQIQELKAQLVKIAAGGFILNGRGNAVLVVDNYPTDTLRHIVNEFSKNSNGIVGVFNTVGNNVEYVLFSSNINMRDFVKEFNAKFNGTGGGSPQMVQGKCNFDVNEIVKHFN